ncbi:MAG: hypothetical protein D6785_00765 [Planctomycetota bacterium]|nr:MAG: hypothetical protein D6785_00765 [Planctomycetota bacterium]
MRYWYLFFFTLFFLSTSYADSLRLASGEERDNIRIMSDGAEKVQFRDLSTNKFESISSEQVIWVSYDRAPKQFKKGMKAYQKYLFKKAIELLSKIRQKKFEPYAKFFIAESYRKMGDFKKAAKAYKYFRKQNHRLTTFALFNLGMVYIYQRNYGSARSVFKDLYEARFSPYWSLMGQYGQGLSYLYRQNYRKAEDLFYQVSEKAKGKKGASYFRLRHLALSGRGLAQVGRKYYKEALKNFNIVLKESNDEEVLAGAYIGLGRMYYSKAKDGKDSKNNYKRALLSFLKVSTLYPGQKLLYAEALHFAALCFKKLGNEKNAKLLKEEIEIRVPKWARYKGF